MPDFFKPNRNFPAELEREPDYQKGLAGIAQAGIDVSRSIALAEAYDQGDYHDGLRVTETANGEVYMSAFDYKSWWIENGSVHNEPAAPLARGAHAVGLKFKADK